ncbi:MAG: biotin/lipoyl-binding protein, partial [Rhizobiales bacterium]|nr:biotin/lipoyl-binding protein [Hyphomicrobiales bacterium]
MTSIHLNTLNPMPQCQTIANRSQSKLLFIICIAVGAFVFWAATSSIDTVTRGGGKVVSALDHQIVQHFEGGIINQILVKEGNYVKAGDALFIIQNSFSEAEHSKIKIDLKAKKITLLRYYAESNNKNILN